MRLRDMAWVTVLLILGLLLFVAMLYVSMFHPAG
jgi:hypothetical protein